MPSAMYFFFRISCLLLQALNETVMAITAIVVRSTDMRLKARPGYIISWLILLLISSFLCDAVSSEEHTSELQSLMSISYAVFCLKTKTQFKPQSTHIYQLH